MTVNHEKLKTNGNRIYPADFHLIKVLIDVTAT